MEIKSQLKHLRISPRKVRLVIGLIKGLSVEIAENQLKFCSKRAAKPILKLLQSAIANAKHNFNLTKEVLYVSKIIVDQGPSLKRWRARAMGRAALILKRTSHVVLLLGTKELPKKRVTKISQKQTAEELEKHKGLVLPAKEKVRSSSELKPVRKQQPWSSQELRKAKRRFYVGDKFKGAAERARKVFRRKSI